MSVHSKNISPEKYAGDSSSSVRPADHCPGSIDSSKNHKKTTTTNGKISGSAKNILGKTLGGSLILGGTAASASAINQLTGTKDVDMQHVVDSSVAGAEVYKQNNYGAWHVKNVSDAAKRHHSGNDGAAFPSLDTRGVSSTRVLPAESAFSANTHSEKMNARRAVFNQGSENIADTASTSFSNKGNDASYDSLDREEIFSDTARRTGHLAKSSLAGGGSSLFLAQGKGDSSDNQVQMAESSTGSGIDANIMDVKNAVAVLSSVELPGSPRLKHVLAADNIKNASAKYQVNIAFVSSEKAEFIDDQGIVVGYPQEEQVLFNVVLNFSKGSYAEEQRVQIVVPQDPDWKILYDIKPLIQELDYHLSPHRDQVTSNLFDYIRGHILGHIPEGDKLRLGIKSEQSNIYINSVNGNIAYPKGNAPRNIDLLLSVHYGIAYFDAILPVLLEATGFPDVETYATSTQVAWKQVYKKENVSIAVGHSISETQGSSISDYTLGNNKNISVSSGYKYSIKMHSTNFIASNFRGVYNGQVKLLLLASDQDEWGVGKLPEDSFFKQKANSDNAMEHQEGYGYSATESTVAGASAFCGRNYWCLGQETSLWAAYIGEKNLTISSSDSNQSAIFEVIGGTVSETVLPSKSISFKPIFVRRDAEGKEQKYEGYQDYEGIDLVSYNKGGLLSSPSLELRKKQSTKKKNDEFERTLIAAREYDLLDKKNWQEDKEQFDIYCQYHGYDVDVQDILVNN